jgi:AP-4 complex subunit beta-1
MSNYPNAPGGPAQAIPGQQYPSNGTNSSNPVPDSYFTESRKGEISELRNLLRSFASERDRNRKRDIIKKVIAYMTLGIDVSRLFSEMMLAIETRYVA